MNVKHDLHELLVEMANLVRSNPSAVESSGICSLLTRGMRNRVYSTQKQDAIWENLHELFREWPYYSGCVSYPVPGDDGVEVFAAFDRAVRNGKMWVSDYGNRRISLLMYCIERTA